jgi:hypothetical protein
MMQKIKELLKDHREGHSKFQVENFIVNSQAHPWHRYKQCLREIAGRRDSVQSGIDQVFVLNSEIKKMKKGGLIGLFSKQKRAKKISALREQKKSAVKSVYNARRELRYFLNAVLALRKKHNYQNLSRAQKEVLEESAWMEKGKFMLCMDMFCFNHPSKQTIEFIYMLPRKIRRELIGQISMIDRNAAVQYLLE